jgi:hypothetical protein
MINFQVNQMCRFQVPHASAIQIRVKMKSLRWLIVKTKSIMSWSKSLIRKKYDSCNTKMDEIFWRAPSNYKIKNCMQCQDV